jgi:hypothetical protein
MDFLLQNLITFFFTLSLSNLVKANKLYNQGVCECEQFENDIKRYTFTYSTESLSLLGLSVNLILFCQENSDFIQQFKFITLSSTVVCSSNERSVSNLLPLIGTGFHTKETLPFWVLEILRNILKCLNTYHISSKVTLIIILVTIR